VNPFTYLLPFLSVLVGLAVTDLATSLHRLLRARRRVQWDWLPLATALLALGAVLNAWWSFYQEDTTSAWTMAEFFPIVLALLVLFLINAAALPDDVPSEGIDLKEFYESNSPYFWSLFAVYIISNIFLNVSGQLASAMQGWDKFIQVLIFSVPNVGILVLFLSLAYFRNRVFHTIAVVSVLVVLAISWSQQRIGAL
jgi:hypothetical protein